MTGPGKTFEPGTTVILREIWQERIWSARPVIVVRDDPDLIALYSPAGTVFKTAVTPAGSRVTPLTRKNADWQIEELTWPGETYGDAIRLCFPGSDYSVILFYQSDFWYVNFEDPLRRTEKGFDYMDQLLDILVKRDGSGWNWKDEDEAEEAVRLGVITPEYVKALYAEGETIVKTLLAGNPLYTEWEKWTPDPSWPVPVLPEGWDRI